MDLWCGSRLRCIPARRPTSRCSAFFLSSATSGHCCRLSFPADVQLHITGDVGAASTGMIPVIVTLQYHGNSADHYAYANRYGHVPPPSAGGESDMRRSLTFHLLLTCALLIVTFGCSRDPNVRKQKYFESGEKYFSKGKYREAEIEYSNALKIDNRFVQAHYQLAQTYLKMKDGNRAGQELARTIELAPDNYEAHFILAELLTNGRNADGSIVPSYLIEAKKHLDVL